jgi:hypothetical protein
VQSRPAVGGAQPRMRCFIRTSRPITRSGRLILAGCVLLVSVVLGFAASTGLYQAHRQAARSSPVLGRLLCGPGQRVGDVPAGRRGRRLICRNEHGHEVSARNNLVAVWMALPFILLIAGPGLWFVSRADIRERRTRP